ncbi:flagellar basal body rod C-terminal domain-containing protein [Wolinella succinogenes]|uniref:flagellar basal body rod C-terminal domain-containing protein n=1 Tax=Wolinella succinogenes TaxID=844 RepID=UPI002409F4D2|nr:flagellar biosynthesis protein FlgE [Wolinella succinogenes]
MQINASSIQAHSAWMNNSSHNVANVNTQGFEALQTNLEESSAQGITANTSKSERATDLTKELPEQMIAERGIEANARTIKTYDDVLGTVLDLKA